MVMVFLSLTVLSDLVNLIACSAIALAPSATLGCVQYAARQLLQVFLTQEQQPISLATWKAMSLAIMQVSHFSLCVQHALTTEHDAGKTLHHWVQSLTDVIDAGTGSSPSNTHNLMRMTILCHLVIIYAILKASECPIEQTCSIRQVARTLQVRILDAQVIGGTDRLDVLMIINYAMCWNCCPPSVLEAARNLSSWIATHDSEEGQSLDDKLSSNLSSWQLSALVHLVALYAMKNQEQISPSSPTSTLMQSANTLMQHIQQHNYITPFHLHHVLQLILYSLSCETCPSDVLTASRQLDRWIQFHLPLSCEMSSNTRVELISQTPSWFNLFLSRLVSMIELVAIYVIEHIMLEPYPGILDSAQTLLMLVIENRSITSKHKILLLQVATFVLVREKSLSDTLNMSKWQASGNLSVVVAAEKLFELIHSLFGKTQNRLCSSATLGPRKLLDFTQEIPQIYLVSFYTTTIVSLNEHDEVSKGTNILVKTASIRLLELVSKNVPITEDYQMDVHNVVVFSQAFKSCPRIVSIATQSLFEKMSSFSIDAKETEATYI